jgi:hypothetical protein
MGAGAVRRITGVKGSVPIAIIETSTRIRRNALFSVMQGGASVPTALSVAGANSYAAAMPLTCAGNALSLVAFDVSTNMVVTNVKIYFCARIALQRAKRIILAKRSQSFGANHVSMQTQL